MTAPADTASGAPAPTYSGVRLIALHLGPGLVTFLVAILLRPVAVANGLPSDLALTIALLTVQSPMLVGYLYWWSRRHARVSSWKPAVPVRRHIGAPGGAIVLVAIVIALAAALLWAPLGGWWAGTLFADVPAWLRPSGHATDPAVTRRVLMVALGLKLAVDGLIAPIAEELYFRGHLLPAMARFGDTAPIANATLFALAQYWQLWNAPMIVMMLLIPAWAVCKYRSVWISVVVRCSVNVMASLFALAAVSAA